VNKGKVTCVLLVAVAILCVVSTRKVKTAVVLVDTRDIPIVQMVIEGPGGDLVPVDHALVYEMGVFFNGDHLPLVVLLLLSALWILKRANGLGLSNGCKKEV